MNFDNFRSDAEETAIPSNNGVEMGMEYDLHSLQAQPDETKSFSSFDPLKLLKTSNLMSLSSDKDEANSVFEMLSFLGKRKGGGFDIG